MTGLASKVRTALALGLPNIARAAMMLPENYASVSKMKDLQAKETSLQAQLAEAYEQWENWQ